MSGARVCFDAGPPVDVLLTYFAHLRLASVDYETDRKIQDTIAYEFKDRTILCIARE